jgi:prolyl-tRNA synthetase
VRYSRFFGKTLREDPSEAETASHRLLLKAGMIRQMASGLYSYLPLAWRSLRKIEGIMRQEMDAAGGQEVRLPALQPQELWEETGRREAFGQNLFTLQDRRERPLVLAPTHEEAITLLVKANVHSYRDLPLLLYQIQTKFRDESRPRAGLIRVREFDMKDAYSFHADDDGLSQTYEAMVQVYRNIFRRCGLPAVQVEADSGAIGGKDSHEFLLPAESGEDVMLSCPWCGYAANDERAESMRPSQEEESPLPLEDVHTPGIKSIEDLAAYLEIPKSKTLKAVFYTCDGQLTFISIRGDLEVNEVKLKNLLHCKELRLATDEEVKEVGLVAGSASLVGLKGVFTVADDSVKLASNFVVGANRPDYHLRNACYPRDFQPDMIADIALAQAGHACRHCGTPLEARRGIEIGHVFKLGAFFSERLGASFLDQDGLQRSIIMGCYGIGVGRLLAAAIEQNHDDKGIVFPLCIAPFQVHMVALNVDDPQVALASDDLHQRLEQAGLEVLYDDRQETAGVKLNDADLLGFPVRIVVSPRALKQGGAELKPRNEREARTVDLSQVVDEVKVLLDAMK